MTLLATVETRSEHLYLGRVLAVVIASLLLIVSAKVSVPFYPVPQTMQTFVIIGLGLALGPSLGCAAIALYLLEGALGFPVFAGTPQKGIGLAYMMGPTGGYLLGAFAAVFVTGHLAKRGWDRTVLTTLTAALFGAIVIYVPGLLWLGSVIGWDKPVLELGLYPFILGDALKVLLLAIAFPALWKYTKKWGQG